jgi:hypothetical protein
MQLLVDNYIFSTGLIFSAVDVTLSQGFTGVFRQAGETFDAHSTLT